MNIPVFEETTIFGNWHIYTSAYTGKWIIAGVETSKAHELCYNAVANGIVHDAKCPDTLDEFTTAIFYTDFKDVAAHKRIIKYLLENNAIPRTQKGTFKNISFKLDIQTRAGQYGKKFKAKLRLGDLIDLKTGEWTYKERAAENEQAAADPPLPVQKDY